MGATEQSIVGTSVRRKEDARFLTGTGQYTDDVSMPNQTQAYFLRSPHAHAKIRSIDTAAAKKAPGVVAIFTGADLEGVASADGTMHPMQAAFKECHALQCGFCTPGMVMSAIDLVERHPGADERAIREGLEGNLCRCTGYHNIDKAVAQGAAAMAK